MFLFDGFLTKAASWREKARIYRIFLGLIFIFIICILSADCKIIRQKMHRLEQLKTGMRKMDQAPYKIGSFEAICISLFFSRKNGQPSFSTWLPVHQNQ